MIWGTVLGGLVAAVLLLFVFPTRTYLDQRHQLAVASARLHLLTSQNASLSGEVDKLHSDAEIERIAREQYHLVRPGEQAFAILPAPSATTTTTIAAVQSQPRSSKRGFWSSIWHHLSSWW